MIELTCFEKASKQNLLFTTNRGLVSINDLWYFSLDELDEIYSKYKLTVESKNAKSYIKKDSTNSDTFLRFSILERIMDIKIHEISETQKLQENKQKKQKLLNALMSAENKELEKKSPEEIKQMIEDLD